MGWGGRHRSSALQAPPTPAWVWTPADGILFTWAAPSGCAASRANQNPLECEKGHTDYARTIGINWDCSGVTGWMDVFLRAHEGTPTPRSLANLTSNPWQGPSTGAMQMQGG